MNTSRSNSFFPNDNSKSILPCLRATRADVVQKNKRRPAAYCGKSTFLIENPNMEAMCSAERQTASGRAESWEAGIMISRAGLPDPFA
jgi:hypothetical protein